MPIFTLHCNCDPADKNHRAAGVTQRVGATGGKPLLCVGVTGGRYHVPKADLVDGAVQTMQKRIVCAADGVPLDLLTEEMRQFGIKSGLRHDRYQGRKDDLVMALCLAIWGAGISRKP